MKTVHEHWQLFKAASPMMERATPFQIDNLRLVFYYGAESALRIVRDIDSDEISEEKRIAILEGLHQEFRAFAREYGLKRGIPKDVIDAIAPEETRKHRV
jgi:hypothetical protein